MSSKNEQNINISKSSNVSLGDVSFNDGSEQGANEKPEEKAKPNPKAAEWKALLAEGKTKGVIALLLTHLKAQNDLDALNAVILHSSSLTQLEMQENLGVIPYEQAKMERAKVTNALLQLIDGMSA